MWEEGGSVRMWVWVGGPRGLQLCEPGVEVGLAEVAARPVDSLARAAVCEGVDGAHLAVLEELEEEVDHLCRARRGVNRSAWCRSV